MPLTITFTSKRKNKLSKTQINNIRASLFTKTYLAKKYNVSRQLINRIINNK